MPTLDVPGARIHYEVRGSGPLLLLLQGGDGDAHGTDGIVEHLRHHHTVLTYDRRGLSRSTPAEPPASLRTHTEDASLLLASLTDEPVAVCGVSLGALIGLDLVTHHADQVHTLIAHEPPATHLLPDSEQAAIARARQATAGDSVAFAALVGIGTTDTEPGVRLPSSGPERAANLAFFTRYDAPAAHSYRLDIPALRGTPTRIVPAAGRTSQQLFPHRVAEALADQLDAPLVEFPGAHNGFVTHPTGFAAAVTRAVS
jgi:pimeloyl-ACP methyl ester carboxylesterase